MRNRSQALRVLTLSAALVLFASPVLAQTPPQVVSVYPPSGASRVPVNVVLNVVFDRPTGKSAAYSLADTDPSAGGGVVNSSPSWSPRGDTLYITPDAPLAYGHAFIWKLNLVVDTLGGAWNDFYYPDIYSFTTPPQARVERVQAGNVSIHLAPDRTLPVEIPVRELAGTDVTFDQARIQFLPSYVVTNTEPTPLDASVSPIYEYTLPISTFLPRFGNATLEAPVRLPEEIARTVPDGSLGLRLTFYGIDETGSQVVVDAVFRVDPSNVIAHQLSVVSPMASDVLVRSVALEWPPHGMSIAAGDSVIPRAVVTGDGTGAFRAGFYLDGELVSMEEGFMEAGRPVEVTMRGPLPMRRFGEHRIQFQVESPQTVPANPISVVCVPPALGLEPPPASRALPYPPPEPPGPSRWSGGVSWIAEGRSHFRDEKASAVGWASWNAGYRLSPSEQLSAELSMRLRFDDTGNGRGAPQRMNLRYERPSMFVQWGDAAPDRASETPLLMSPVPRRSAQAVLRRSPLGELSAYVAMDSRPISAAGPLAQFNSDLYAARLTRSAFNYRVLVTAYGGYTHEEPAPGVDSTDVRRSVIYGGMARVGLPGRWTLVADAATVHHRAPEAAGDSAGGGSSRTAWRGDLSGAVAGFQAQAQAFSYQPSLETALNPYALSDRRGGFARLERDFLNWNLFGSFRSEEPVERHGLVPVVRVQRGTFGLRVNLGPDSWVVPSFVRVTHRGANTEMTENRIATEFTNAEPLGGRTTARFDVAFFKDDRLVNSRRRVAGGSLVTTRRHPGRVTSTVMLGVEQNSISDLHLNDTTFQGSFEARWEAVQGRFLVAPFVSAVTRRYELSGTKEDRYSGKLQLAFLRILGLGDNVLALEGRVDRIQHLQPAAESDLDASAKLTLGQKFDLR